LWKGSTSHRAELGSRPLPSSFLFFPSAETAVWLQKKTRTFFWVTLGYRFLPAQKRGQNRALGTMGGGGTKKADAAKSGGKNDGTPEVLSFKHSRDDCDKGNDFAGMDVGQMESQRKKHTSAYSRTSSAAFRRHVPLWVCARVRM